MVFSEVRAEHDEAFNRWYNEEHLPNGCRYPACWTPPATRRWQADPNIWRVMNWHRRMR